MSDELPLGLVEDDRSFVLDILDERGAIQRELEELDVIVQQNTTEFESATQRLQRVQNTYREYEPRLESLPRDEMKRLLVSVHQAELRHAVVGEQRARLTEKVEAHRKLLLVIEFTLKLAALTGLPVPQTAADLSRAKQAHEERELTPSRRGDSPAAKTESDSTGETPGLDPAPEALVKIIQAQEEERQRLAKQMHDGPAQSMTNLILRAELCERLVRLQPERAATELAELKNMVNNTLQETRQFIFDVRPMILDDLGLVPAVRRYVDEINQKGIATVIFTVKGPDRRLPSPIEIVLFRIIQDALKLQESRSHEKSTQIVLTMAGTEVELSVHYPQAMDTSRATKGESKTQDFTAIHQRVATMRGKLDVEDSGTHSVLHVTVPVPISASDRSRQ